MHVSELMHKYGVWFILSFRFVYGVRNVSSITIGMIHYPWIRFAVVFVLRRHLRDKAAAEEAANNEKN